jgi:hypothetical protein
VKIMNVKQRTLGLFKHSIAPGASVSLRKARENKNRLLVGLLMAVTFWSVPTLAQEKNEAGLVIGGIVTPSRTLSPGVNLVSPSGTPLPNSNITFNSALTLGADYDRNVLHARGFAISGGIDFLASPLDVKLDQRPANVINQYAFVFLTPHVRVKFHPSGFISPWLSFGGGYARFRETAPVNTTSFNQGTNTGAFVFGGGLDTRPVLHVLRIPIGFRLEIRDFYSGQPNYNQKTTGNLQNNVAFTGGLLIRF